MDYFFNIYGDRESRPPKGTVIIGVTDEKGNWPSRCKREYPYSYDPICHFLSKDVKANGTVYDDRMQQWDSAKHSRAVKAHCPQGWYSFNNPTAVEAMLRDYFDDPSIKLACIVEYCNKASGYASFRFDYWQEEKK